MEGNFTTSSRIEQLIEYRLQLVRLLSYSDPAERAQIGVEITLIDSFIGEIRGLKRMILVVDDDQLLAETLVEVLRCSGYEAFSTAHVGDAVALSADLRPDLAVIDVMLGEASGIELALELQKCVPTMKLLMVLGHPESSKYVAAVQPGVVPLGFLERPVPPEELLDAIAGLLGQIGAISPKRLGVADLAHKQVC